MKIRLTFVEHRVCTYCGQENAILTAYLFRNGPIQVVSCGSCGGSLAETARRFSLGLFHFEATPKKEIAAEPAKETVLVKPYRKSRRKDVLFPVVLQIYFYLGITFLMVKMTMVEPGSYIIYLFWASVFALVAGITNRWHKNALWVILLGAVLWLGGFISMFWFGTLGAQIGTIGTMLMCFTSIGSNFLVDNK